MKPMMKHHVTQEWKLGSKGHEQYDFIDVNLSDDNLLFIDPCRIEESNHPIAKQCVATIISFFDMFFIAYRNRSQELKRSILSHASEENSTYLGYGYPGKGNTADGLIKTFAPLDKLIESIPTINVAQDLPVLLAGFAEDGLSDLITNIIHIELNEYTLKQMSRYGKHPTSITDFYSWNANTQSWQLYTDQPCYIYKNKPIMLVPKEFVRKNFLFSASQYMHRIIVERIREEGGGYDPDGKPIPKTYYLEHCIPHDSENWIYEEVLKYTKEHPDALSEYHDKLPDFYFENRKRINDDVLDEVVY